MIDGAKPVFHVYLGTLNHHTPLGDPAPITGIFATSLNASGALSPGRLVDQSLNDVIWMLTDQAGAVLYATFDIANSDQSHVAAFRIHPETADLEFLTSQPTGGTEASHATLSADGRHLLVANYNPEGLVGRPDQAVRVFPVSASDGLGAPTDTVRHNGSGPRKDRQARAHPHCVLQRPNTSDIYVADLGMDRIFVYGLSKDGQLTHKPDCDFSFPAGDGPRHIVFSNDGARMFVVCELNAKVLSYDLANAAVPTNPIDVFAISDARGVDAQPSGIALSGAGDALLVALRGCDEILSLHVSPDGKLTQAGRSDSGGKTPRDMKLLPSGRHLIVANQDGANVSVFSISPDDIGTLTKSASLVIDQPMAIAVLPYDPSATADPFKETL